MVEEFRKTFRTIQNYLWALNDEDNANGTTKAYFFATDIINYLTNGSEYNSIVEHITEYFPDDDAAEYAKVTSMYINSKELIDEFIEKLDNKTKKSII